MKKLFDSFLDRAIELLTISALCGGSWLAVRYVWFFLVQEGYV